MKNTPTHSQQINNQKLILLSALFTSSLVCANLLGSMLVVIFGVTVSVGIFVFPITFIVIDIITEVYGKKTAVETVKVGLVIQIYVLGFVYFAGLFTPSPIRDLSEAYKQMFSLTPRMVLASIVAYGFSQFLDVSVFAKLKDKFSGRFLLLRTNLTSWFIQFIDTAIFMSIFLGGVLPFEVLWKSFLTAYITKMIVATCDSPFVNLGVKYLRKSESK